jgi:hypothetical protein
MSYTQFVGTAKCRVAEDFDLNQFLMSTADWIGNNVDDQENENLSANDKEALWHYEDRTHEAVCVDLSNYLQLTGDQLLINVDSEEQNTMIWDWLIDQVLHSAMVSNIMVVNSASIDSRMGVECSVGYYTKDGDFISSDAAIALLEQSVH